MPQGFSLSALLNWIAGLTYSHEFVATAEEAELVTAIDVGHWNASWDSR
jgi:hypothetical protein